MTTPQGSQDDTGHLADTEGVKVLSSKADNPSASEVLREVLAFTELTQVGEVIRPATVAHILSNVERGVYKGNRDKGDGFDLPHPHRTNSIINRDEDGKETITGEHCFTCGQTYKYPSIHDIGQLVEVTDMMSLDPDPNTSVPSRPVAPTPEQLREILDEILFAVQPPDNISRKQALDEIMAHFATFLASIELPEKHGRYYQPYLLADTTIPIEVNQMQAEKIAQGVDLGIDQCQAILTKIAEELTK